MRDSDQRPFQLSILLATFSLALLLRLYGLSWGLPNVFEEATPLREAWKMWGWGPRSDLDMNPHFFNYPSLTIYCQFLGQGILYIVMRLRGVVESTIDYSALYVADPAAFLVTGRLITALFGAGTVWVLYRLCLRIASPLAAGSAAFFLAISTFHIEKSQVVEVDVPLAFFSSLALLFIIRIIDEPSRRRYLLTGAAIGLAVSTKYTAAILVIPLIVSHILARRSCGGSSRAGSIRKGKTPGWGNLVAAIGVMALLFFVTSPYILLDASTFLHHLSLERIHMREGHFGLDRSGTVWFYLKVLSERMVGWPLLLLAAAGFAYRVVRCRRGPELVLGSFVVFYCIAVASWAMKADRYLLPVLPIVLIFAAAALDDVLRLPWIAGAGRLWRAGSAGILLLAAVIPIAAAYPSHLERYAPDTRALAREWIEANVPSGAFITMESYGPGLLGPQLLLSLDREVRKSVLKHAADRPQYAVQPLPMLQVYPEKTAVFYDMNLYADTDVFVVSSAVGSRYNREPERFSHHIAFYDSLEIRLQRLQEFTGKTGPTVTIYKRRGRIVPFAGKKIVDGPRPLRRAALSGTEALFYSNLGMNYEAFRHYEEAIACYDMAFGYAMARPSWYTEIVFGKTRSLMALGRPDEAVSFLLKAAESAPSARMRERVLDLIRSIREKAAGKTP